MPTNTPEELVHTFLRAFNAGDIDALIALFEPQAILVAQSGQVTQGHAALREGFDAFLSLDHDRKPRPLDGEECHPR